MFQTTNQSYLYSYSNSLSLPERSPYCDRGVAPCNRAHRPPGVMTHCEWETTNEKKAGDYGHCTCLMDIYYIYNYILVGGLNPSEKYSSIGMIIPNIWENKKCSKPPTR